MATSVTTTTLPTQSYNGQSVTGSMFAVDPAHVSAVNVLDDALFTDNTTTLTVGIDASYDGGATFSPLFPDKQYQGGPRPQKGGQSFPRATQYALPAAQPGGVNPTHLRMRSVVGGTATVGHSVTLNPPAAVVAAPKV